MFVNSGTSLSPATASLIILIPVISTAKPRKIAPRFFLEALLLNIVRAIPISARSAESAAGLTSSRNMFPFDSIPVRLRIHAVTVVPTFAPIIMPIA